MSTASLAYNARARKLLAWTPTVSLQDGLEALIDWHWQSATDWQRALDDDAVHNWELPSGA